MSHKTVRVRFAPAPTGMMHLGNIRTALMNALYAQRYNGTFVLRIEDTDADRNYDPNAEHIRADLSWLGLTYQEGPIIEGPYPPYFQSQRMELYKRHLTILINTKKVYRCFCTEEELERKRERQRALKQPPRYDRTCLHKNIDTIQSHLDTHTPFVWRLALDETQSVTIYDLAHKEVTFHFKNFSDFPLTRQDGSFTFLFANCVDDIDMQITHVFRGEDHLSNTACQAALYRALNAPLPIFWHMPILCNIDGKKLSKRDFGFSLRDLRDAGFLPEAVLNYLAIIGSSYPEEIMDFPSLVSTIELDSPHATGRITYDVDKFHWVNRKWIERLSPAELLERCLSILERHYPTMASANQIALMTALQTVKPEMNTLLDAAGLLDYFFNTPTDLVSKSLQCMTTEELSAATSVLKSQLEVFQNADTLGSSLKQAATNANVPLKHLYWSIRLAITGRHTGPNMHELIAIVGPQEAIKRVQAFAQLFV
jgi:nondiscriminating glutamyl-tRNA synthetase